MFKFLVTTVTNKLIFILKYINFANFVNAIHHFHISAVLYAAVVTLINYI